MKSRPALAMVVAVLQTVIAALCVAGAIFYVVQVYSAPSGKTPEESQQIVMGLRLTAWIVSASAVVAILICWALWKKWRWGWWLGAVFYTVSTISMLWGPVIERERMDADDITTVAVFLGFTILLFLPPVWRFYLSRPKAEKLA